MAKVLFGDHPYHVTAPTQESIAAATSADLRRIFAQRFRPDQAVLVAVGDFDNAKMMEIAKAHLGSWKAPADTPSAPPSHPSGTPEHVRLCCDASGLGSDHACRWELSGLCEAIPITRRPMSPIPFTVELSVRG